MRESFDRQEAMTVGLEEELMLLDPESLDLVPSASAALERVAGDGRFKLELPAAQLEIVTPPCPRVAEAAAELRGARQELAAATEGTVRLAAAGVHPFSAAEGELNQGERYDRTHREYGEVARRQLVFALQVHVAPGSADRALAVHNCLRSFLPELAALAANAPYYQGRDTGLASVRPKIAEMLPRQGVPPPIPSWEEYAEALAWGTTSGALPEPAVWWWELRLHPFFGTLEVRVPDAQTTVREAAAIAAFAQALVGWLCERHDAGERLPIDPSWRIEQNRWWALRDGVEGQLADLATGERRSTRTRLSELVETVTPAAERVGCAQELELARGLIEANGAIRQREVGARSGPSSVARWLSDRYLDGC